MPLPWIVGGIIAGGVALVGSAAREVNEDLKHDLNRINREMEEMHRNTTALVEKTSEDFKQVTKAFDLTKESIIKTTLKDYSLIISELRKNTSYCGDYKSEADFNFLNYNISYYNDNS